MAWELLEQYDWFQYTLKKILMLFPNASCIISFFSLMTFKRFILLIREYDHRLVGLTIACVDWSLWPTHYCATCRIRHSLLWLYWLSWSWWWRWLRVFTVQRYSVLRLRQYYIGNVSLDKLHLYGQNAFPSPIPEQTKYRRRPHTDNEFAKTPVQWKGAEQSNSNLNSVKSL